MSGTINLCPTYIYEFNNSKYVRFSAKEWYRFIGDKSLASAGRETAFIEKAFQTRLKQAHINDEFA